MAEPIVIGRAHVVSQAVVNEGAFRRIGSGRRQGRVISEYGCAIRTDVVIALAHLEIDVWVILGRRCTDAGELPRTNPYLADT